MRTSKTSEYPKQQVRLGQVGQVLCADWRSWATLEVDEAFDFFDFRTWLAPCSLSQDSAANEPELAHEDRVPGNEMHHSPNQQPMLAAQEAIAVHSRSHCGSRAPEDYFNHSPCPQPYPVALDGTRSHLEAQNNHGVAIDYQFLNITLPTHRDENLEWERYRIYQYHNSLIQQWQWMSHRLLEIHDVERQCLRDEMLGNTRLSHTIVETPDQPSEPVPTFDWPVKAPRHLTGVRLSQSV